MGTILGAIGNCSTHLMFQETTDTILLVSCAQKVAPVLSEECSGFQYLKFCLKSLKIGQQSQICVYIVSGFVQLFYHYNAVMVHFEFQRCTSVLSLSCVSVCVCGGGLYNCFCFGGQYCSPALIIYQWAGSLLFLVICVPLLCGKRWYLITTKAIVHRNGSGQGRNYRESRPCGWRGGLGGTGGPMRP